MLLHQIFVLRRWRRSGDNWCGPPDRMSQLFMRHRDEGWRCQYALRYWIQDVDDLFCQICYNLRVRVPWRGLLMR